MPTKPETETEVEEVETVDVDPDDTAEILEDAKELSKDGTTEVKENETPEESVKQALKDLSKEQGDGSEDKEVTAEADKPVDTGIKAPKESKKAKDAPFDPELVPPSRFELSEKELFNRLPKDLKRALNRTVKNLEGMATKAATEAAREKDDSRYIREAVQPYATEFGRMGMTVPQGIAALLSAHTNLTKPETSLQAYIALGKDLGHDTSSLEGKLSEATGNADLSSHPDIIALRNENKRLREIVEPINANFTQTAQSQNDAATNAIITELESVMNEMDASGRYVNPKLHEAEFLEAWKPLVSAIIRTDKTVKSYAEAGKKAYDRLTGRSSSNGSTIPSSRNNRSVSASISVRGRSAAPAGVVSEETAIPVNETPEQSARAALEELRRGL